MGRKRAICTTLALLAGVLLTRSAAAQVVYPIGEAGQYGIPARPTLSPYLDLLRNDSGAISPYHAFVLPRREIVQQQTQQAANLRRLERASFGGVVGGQVQNLRLPTGRGGSYQDYSHFYHFNSRHR